MSIASCTDVQNPHPKHETIELTPFKTSNSYPFKHRANSLPLLNLDSIQRPLLVRSRSAPAPDSPIFGRRNSNFPYKTCVYLPVLLKGGRMPNGSDLISSSDPSFGYKIVWID